MPINQAGAVNLTGLTVPDVYINIVPPSVVNLNGIPTNIIGIVGTATWGPVGTPVIASGPNDATASFGPAQNRKYDLLTPVYTASLQGGQNFRLVRGTDGTDTSATFTYSSNCLTLTGLHTGTLGNTIQAVVQLGSKAASYKVILSIGSGLQTMPQQQPEVFDSITGTGAAFWANVALAINNGTSSQRGPSQLAIAASGAGTISASTAVTATAVTPWQLSGGTDGASVTSIAGTPTLLIGNDVAPRTGIYALRGQCGGGVAFVSDMDAAAEWTTLDAFGASEGVYMMQVDASGDTISNASTLRATSGLDSYNSKLMFGDWLDWGDPVNNITRLVSPQGFIAGEIANLSPNQSSLNKPMSGIQGSQKRGLIGSRQSQVYAAADLSVLALNGLDVITNPIPYGPAWGARLGLNTSSNPAINGDNYTRMTNYIALTLAGGMGIAIGQPITPTLLGNITATLTNFLANMQSAGQLSPGLQGQPAYGVTCNGANNPQSATSLGYVRADVQVTYQGITRFFIVNLEGGQTVVVTSPSQPNS
jgi:hypothetical protein